MKYSLGYVWVNPKLNHIIFKLTQDNLNLFECIFYLKIGKVKQNVHLQTLVVAYE